MVDVDHETAKVVSQSQEIKDMVAMPGWRQARRRLFERMVELDSIDAMLLDRDPKDVMLDILSRKTVIQLMRNWVMEIEGEAATVDHTVKSFADERRDDVIIELDKKD